MLKIFFEKMLQKNLTFSFTNQDLIFNIGKYKMYGIIK